MGADGWPVIHAEDGSTRPSNSAHDSISFLNASKSPEGDPTTSTWIPLCNDSAVNHGSILLSFQKFKRSTMASEQVAL
jgi:hypothetical protein